MKLETNQQFHLGVYGICRKGDEVLVIKKGRGPYKGLYDLPGGGIEFGEKIEVALKREFEEEIGTSVTSFNFLDYNDYFCQFINDSGERKDFHHTGLYFIVECSTSTIKTEADGRDSLGALFVPVSELGAHNCSLIALEMIQKVSFSSPWRLC